MSTVPDRQGFAYSREQFQSLVEDVLRHAQTLGASEAAAEVSEGCGLLSLIHISEPTRH